MSVARHANAPVLLVGDIDKGGVFASLYGTIALLDKDADYIKAFIINKFRGDLDILKPGLTMIQEKTDRPVLGVIPYLGDLGLHEEDGIPLERLWWSSNGKFAGPKIKIVVVRLRYISNFTDFDPFLYEQDVELVYSLRDADIETRGPRDHSRIKEHGAGPPVPAGIRASRQASNGRRKRAFRLPVCAAGIRCSERRYLDPHGIEGPHQEIDGLGLLDVETIFDRVKTTCQVEAEAVQSSEFGVQSGDAKTLKGYEIHMGRTIGDIGLFKLKRRVPDSELRTLNSELIPDGSQKGNVWGTYIHGIFDNDDFRRGLINALRAKRGLTPVEDIMDFAKARDAALDKWAEVLRESIDMRFIQELIA